MEKLTLEKLKEKWYVVELYKDDRNAFNSITLVAFVKPGMKNWYCVKNKGNNVFKSLEISEAIEFFNNFFK